MPGLTFHFPGSTAFVVAIVLGTVAAVIPARRAARLNVIEALSYEYRAGQHTDFTVR